MKINKQQLQKIIREELRALLGETAYGGAGGDNPYVDNSYIGTTTALEKSDKWQEIAGDIVERLLEERASKRESFDAESIHAAIKEVIEEQTAFGANGIYKVELSTAAGLRNRIIVGPA